MMIDTDKLVHDTYYDPKTGKIFRVREIKATSEYEYEADKPRAMRFSGLNKQCTHVIFFIMTGRWPIKGMQIDHIDGDPNNNSWENLREVTPSQNQYNAQPRGRWVNSEDGLERGVFKFGNQYYVQINGVHFDHFHNKEEANSLAKSIRRRLHGEHAYDANEFVRRF